jgi:hypothetical protein
MEGARLAQIAELLNQFQVFKESIMVILLNVSGSRE